MVEGGEYMLNHFEDSQMMYGDVFDKIDDLLDFSNEEMQMLMEPEPLTFNDAQGTAADSGFPPPNDAPTVGGGPPGETIGIKTDDNAFPCDDIDVAELEWLSHFVEESFSPASTELPKSGDIIVNNNYSGNSSISYDDGVEAIRDRNKVVGLHYRTPSPVSVLEQSGPVKGGGGSFSSSSSPTSSSCSSMGSGVKVFSPFNSPESVAVRGRAPRTKRTRPPSGNRPNVLMPIVPSSTEGTCGDSLLLVPSATSEVENVAESNPTLPETEAPPAVHKTKKIKIVSSAREAENSQIPVRKCMHCQIQKTPQWRAGPMGPKTLCNACGVRYKSGRLFPEYRPAASPTFVASQHSNSHKKVVEMRVKASKEDTSMVPSSLPASAKGCELLNYIRGNRECSDQQDTSMFV